jgi:hypothetical protein
MRKHFTAMVVVFQIAVALQLVLAVAIPRANAQAQAPASAYPTMAPLDQYLSADKDSEIALARSAAPKSISDAAEVMVLTRDGYATAETGTNGFLCIVERGWAAPSDSPDFWNPKLRGPNCYNPAAAKSYVPIYLLRTKLALAGKSKAEIVQESESALTTKQLPVLEPGAMCYMLSKSQYLGDEGKSWHPHLMFFVAGDVEKTWGADQPGSPIIASNNPEEGVTIFMVLVPKWSDGTPAPPTDH